MIRVSFKPKVGARVRAMLCVTPDRKHRPQAGSCSE